ncbi:MAG: ferrochelatase [Thermoleophilia bacterium]
MERVAVLVLAYGGPESLDEVAPFLRRIMAPREPSVDAVARAVERYSRIGGRSPLMENTREQARSLEERLNAGESGGSTREGTAKVFRVFVGARHTVPGVAAALELAADAADRAVVAVVLASHQSDRATGGYLSDLASAYSALPESERTRLGPPLVVDSWHTSVSYLQAVAVRIQEAEARLTERAAGGRPVVMFTAHSLPLVDGAGDPEYERRLGETIGGVVPLISPPPGWLLAYQSASPARGGAWLGPDVGGEMRRLAAEGVDRVVVMPLGFVSEHLETLFDLDIELAGVAAEAGVAMERAATVQGTTGLMEALAEAVRGSLAGIRTDAAVSLPSLEVRS